ncbi:MULTISPECIES: SpoIIE family protein phosphatase [Lysinibacillus]|uniref:Stage II sporulation protein E n=1 Tax=Lysinibacillus antri TaxID=2498145 RepID=A0A432L8J3_9BACI|nr:MULTISPECIES: SpoIIE family protein phosphatase [Lysinibacillus]RUL49133.1 stage II sporulation protein E [Lysinibacillus antri]TSI05479.1 SpoIIE family protein phosphatase [Lysinibacillus sp. BW-2-10]
MANIEMIDEKTPLQGVTARLSIKKMSFFIHLFFLLLALFLSRAVMFEAAVPFLLPLWAIVKKRYENKKWSVLVGGLVGALTLSIGQALILVLQIVLYELITRFRFWKFPTAIAVGMAIFLGQFMWQGIAHLGIPPLIVQLYIYYEVLLAFFMTIFVQLFFVQPHRFWASGWSYERVGAGLVILAMMLTGVQSVAVSYFALFPFMLHLAICIAAITGGVPIAAMVATIVGALVGIAKLSFTGMISVYAMTGVVAGLFSRLGRTGVVLGSFVPSIFFFFYDATLPIDTVYFVSVLVAGIVFFALPQNMIQFLHDVIHPKRDEVLLQRQQWLTNHTNEKLETFQNFVLFMKELVFDRFTSTESVNEVKQIEPTATCMSCFRYDHCWGERNNGMEDHIEDWYIAKSSMRESDQVRVEKNIKLKCIKSTKLLEELDYQLYNDKMNGQFYHGKKMIALQLRDLSNHLNRLMEDMKNETLSFKTIEEELEQEFKRASVQCFQIDVINNTMGERVIICSLANKNKTYDDQYLLCERIILPILYDVFAEPFQVEKISEQKTPFSHVQVRFRSAVRYEVEYDIYSRAKNTGWVSGDSHAVFHIHPGLVAVMLSDGMGQSREAQRESRRLIRLMRECLTYNMNPETAMHTLHYVMSLNREVDMYATIDFALVDLQKGALWSWKAGSMSTYILRGERMIKVDGTAAPVGFMPVFSIETEKVNLLADDYVVMVSDGVFSGEYDWEEQERYFVSLLKSRIQDEMPIEVILYDVMEQFSSIYAVEDDCTVILLNVAHVVPKWAVFSPLKQEVS